MGFSVGFITGHTLVAPAVSIYIAVIMTSLTASCRRLNGEKAALKKGKSENTP
jgi:hydrogenase maturation factor